MRIKLTFCSESHDKTSKEILPLPSNKIMRSGSATSPRKYRIISRFCGGIVHVWMYMDPARLQAGLANSGPRVTTADVYPASLCGVSDRRRRREPRWIFARFHLNGAKALAPRHWPKPCRSRHQVREATE